MVGRTCKLYLIMNKLLRHKWIEQLGFKTHQCSRCGLIRYWDTIEQRLLFRWKGMIGYTAPSCDLPNTKPNNTPY